MHIDGFVFFAQIVNFLILIYLLKRFLYGRIIQAMDNREAKIAARIAEAETMKVDAAAAAENYAQKMKGLDARFEALLNEARLEAEERRKELLAKAREEVDGIQKNWQEALKRQQEAFLQELRRLTGQQLWTIVGRVLADLADADLEQRIVKVFLHRLTTLDEQRRLEIKASLRGEGELYIDSAFAIAPEAQEQIRSVLKGHFTNGVRIFYRVRPEVVSGIEMRAHGHKIAWSFQEYMETMQENLSQALQREAQGTA
ncbi:MAG TPA: hypothetical protein PKX61_08125 [Syntrophales bacterium]|jgi:F-type H+-transporting ATPase subunit b|nr:hypothetical protein [Syntrophales bacterium]HQN26373.1 hypothetical protein [Syntrophales bacterium]